jgi:8-oxo-dGTP diphosphatase
VTTDGDRSRGGKGPPASLAGGSPRGATDGDRSRGAPTLGVAAVVFDDAGRILLIERGRPPGEGLWTLPGGRLEPGEALVAGVAREVREETNLEVEVGPLVEIVERIGSGYHYVILDYLARVTSGTLAAASDARRARFIDAAELVSLPLTDGLLPVIARARATHATWSTSR